MTGGPHRARGVLVAAAAALGACGAALGSTIPLSARVLRPSEVPHLIRLAPAKTATNATAALRGLDPEFRPKAALRLFLREHFRGGVEQDLQGTGRWKNVGGYDAAAEFATPTGASAVAAYFHSRSLGFCLRACDVQIKEVAVPGIPGARGSHRYRLTKTRFGQAFDYYYVVFSVGPWAYAVNMLGPPGTITPAEVFSAAAALYHRARG
jgi:hypothetical protein